MDMISARYESKAASVCDSLPGTVGTWLRISSTLVITFAFVVTPFLKDSTADSSSKTRSAFSNVGGVKVESGRGTS